MEKIIEIIKPFEEALLVIEKIINMMKKLYYVRPTKKTINDFAIKTNNGYAYSKSEKSENGLYGIYTIKNISGSKKFDRSDIVKNNMLEIGEVITGLSGTIGTAGLVDSDGYVSNQRTLAITSKYAAQISFSINMYKEKSDTISTGAVQKNITADNILSLPFEPIYDTNFEKLYLSLLIIRKNILNVRDYMIELLVK